jgi:hypothetical protein
MDNIPLTPYWRFIPMSVSNCPSCNFAFSKKRDWQRFCSDKCRVAFHRPKPVITEEETYVIIKGIKYIKALNEK